MLWWLLSVGIILFVLLLYACVTAGARADRDMKKMMKNIRKKS